jgi:hypothetical protein
MNWRGDQSLRLPRSGQRRIVPEGLTTSGVLRRTGLSVHVTEKTVVSAETTVSVSGPYLCLAETDQKSRGAKKETKPGGARLKNRIWRRPPLVNHPKTWRVSGNLRRTATFPSLGASRNTTPAVLAGFCRADFPGAEGGGNGPGGQKRIPFSEIESLLPIGRLADRAEEADLRPCAA